MNRHSRRAAEKQSHSTTPSIEALLADCDLTERAHELVESRLAAYGSVLSHAHRLALMVILGRFTHLANGFKSGRYAYDLPCGCGKSESVVSWITASWELQKPFSVLVCASKVEELCAIIRKLYAAGVPESAIGLIHSYDHKPELAEEARKGKVERYASLPATTDNDGRQFLFMTHAKVRRGGVMPPYHGKERNLVVWDESLIQSEHRAIEALPIRQGLGYLGPLVDENSSDGLKAVYDYLSSSWATLEDDMKAQKDGGRKPRALYLNPLDPDDLNRMMAAIPEEDATEALRHLLTISQAPLRAVAGNQKGGAFVRYEIVVPPELRNVSVLDASWAIRDLEKLDRTIQDDPQFRDVFRKHGEVKQYDTVTAHFMKAPSGRASMEAEFLKPREDRKLAHEIASVVQGIPSDEAVILFTHKHRKKKARNVNIAEKLKGDLQATGVDTDATIPVLITNPDTKETTTVLKPRFVWLTFGQETAISEYSYAQNVIFVGMIHRSDADLSGAIVGQKDDLVAEVTTDEIASVRRSEIAHVITQGSARGACRVTEAGRAKPMKLWLMHNDDGARDLVSKAMPGIEWVDWKPAHFEETGTIKLLAKRIAEYLDNLPLSVTKVSTQKLKEGLSANAHANTFTKAKDLALKQSREWAAEGRSLTRTK